MPALIRLLRIAVAYLLAFLLACGVLALHVAATDSPERQASSGMASFGDTFLFLCAFGVGSVPATVYAMRELAACRACAVALAAAALVLAASALAAVIAFVGWRAASAATWMGVAAMLAPMRMLFAPMLALLFAVAAACVAARGPRIALALAAAAEALAFGAFVLVLFGSR